MFIGSCEFRVSLCVCLLLFERVGAGWVQEEEEERVWEGVDREGAHWNE